MHLVLLLFFFFTAKREEKRREEKRVIAVLAAEGEDVERHLHPQQEDEKGRASGSLSEGLPYLFTSSSVGHNTTGREQVYLLQPSLCEEEASDQHVKYDEERVIGIFYVQENKKMKQKISRQSRLQNKTT